MIQLYEQKQNDISKTQVTVVINLAKAFGCDVEDLIDLYPVIPLLMEVERGLIICRQIKSTDKDHKSTIEVGNCTFNPFHFTVLFL